MAKERKEVKKEDTWNVESLYPSLEAWEKDFENLTKNKSEKYVWPQLAAFKGKVHEGAKTLNSLLNEFSNVERVLSKLYTYAHLRHDEDVSNEVHKHAYDRISLLYHDFSNELSWVDPEVLQLPEEDFNALLKDKILEKHRIQLEKLFALKPYTLSTDKEQLLSLASKALGTPSKTFGVLNNAELSFEVAKDESGKQHELTHGTYSLYLQSKDRTLRKNAVLNLHNKYEEFENTISELINGHVQGHVFNAKARGYDSALHAALTPHQIDVKVYKNMISTVRENIAPLHKYVSLRKKLLGVDQLHFYDLYTSLVPKYDKVYSYNEAEKLVLDAVKPLGESYHETLSKGFGTQRWVDRYENARKRSGAYSSGCYDSVPFILMNFQGTLRDVFTLAHEAGHSMHSYCSNKNQPYEYASYPIFVAEVASTFNEELLFKHLMKNAKSHQEKCYLLNQKIDDIRATLFRQTQFAEFEYALYDLAEKGVPLNAATLKETYRKLNQDYYGKDLYLDPEIDVEFLRIPHFYYNFYVYQYATGISAANALVQRLMKDGDKALKDYLKFLSSGSSRYPVDLLEMAGVDMKKKEPIEILINRFSSLVDEFEKEFSAC